MAAPTSKMLLVFCDGTGQDGNLTAALSTAENSSFKPKIFPTNVLFLSRAIQPLSKDNKRQITLYISGVGTDADFNGDLAASDTALQAFGFTAASKIRDAYAFLAQNYEEGDEICLFGFSRGAYTVRKVAGLIDSIGLLQRESLGNLFGIWHDMVAGNKPKIPNDTRTGIRIKCVGIWDTVAATIGTVDALNIVDKSPLPNVEIALHAVALQENRGFFLPTLWNPPKQGLSPSFKQVWFPGVHTDVGGGYEKHELSDLALIWMVGEITSFINVDTGFIRRCLQQHPGPWGSSKPHNEGLVIGDIDRLVSGRITKDDVFHESLQYAPTNLANLIPMITFEHVKKKFGPHWQPKWAPLNDFEKECKANWGKLPAAGGATFKSPAVLLNGAPTANLKL